MKVAEDDSRKKQAEKEETKMRENCVNCFPQKSYNRDENRLASANLQIVKS